MNYKRVIKNYSKKEKKLSRYLVISLIALFAFKFIIGQINNFTENQRKDMYTEFIPEKFTGINPFYESYSKSNSDISKLLYRGLIKINPETKEYESDLAAFIVNDDSTEFKFMLNNDQYWSDGSPITNNDIITTYNEIIKSNNFNNQILKSNFEGVKIYENTNKEIIFKLESPNNFFLANLTLAIVPKSTKESFLKQNFYIKEDNCEECIFSGDFNLEKIIEKDNFHEIILKSEELKIKNIRFLISNENQEITKESNSNFYTTNTDQYYLLPKYTALFINQENEFLRNINLRRAINNSIKKEELGEKLFNKIMIDNPFFQYEENKSAQNNTSISEIKETLENKGFEYKEDILFYNNKPVRIGLIIQNFEINKERNQENQIIKDYLEEKLKSIGIQIVSYNYDKETFQDLLLGKNYDLALFGHDLGNNLDSYGFWHSSQTNPGSLNISNYQNALTDKLLEKLRKNSSSKNQIKLVKDLNRELKNNLPAIFLFTEKKGFEVDNKIKNRKILESYYKPSDRFFDINLWTINNF
ncbi:hypothetical protein CL656_04135 [bacterium]|nr:hypothetical protein [bacterium]|tara:strand:- start:3329 stop:4918 length:1590 start_codon:yes stop_codon:yes gene_type:complete